MPVGACGDPKAPPLEAPGQGITDGLLLVDDHPINRQVASLFLRPFNMRIVEATNGKEALDLIAQHEFDIVLLDVHMPVMDGKEAIQRLRAERVAAISQKAAAL